MTNQMVSRIGYAIPSLKGKITDSKYKPASGISFGPTGAFEIYYNDELIFSKLKEGRVPDPEVFPYNIHYLLLILFFYINIGNYKVNKGKNGVISKISLYFIYLFLKMCLIYDMFSLIYYS
ncbi:hypothetical protein WA158_001788 [Blastocystis sp. Blastoise]